MKKDPHVFTKHQALLPFTSQNNPVQATSFPNQSPNKAKSQRTVHISNHHKLTYADSEDHVIVDFALPNQECRFPVHVTFLALQQEPTC